MSDSAAGDDAQVSGESRDAEREDTRSPKSVYGVGEEPDPRFSLANERTALAWIRTGLSMIAGGIALTSFATLADMPVMMDIVAAIASIAGGVLALNALLTWRRTERAMRLRHPLPAPTGLFWLVGGVVVFGLLLAGYAAAHVG